MQQQQVCTNLSAIFFSFYTVSYYILFVSQKSLNDEERVGNCLLVPERRYGPAPKFLKIYIGYLLVSE